MTTTHRDYDLAEISKSIRGVLMGIAIMAVMHLYMGYTNPYVALLTQAYHSEHYSAQERARVQHGQDLDLGRARYGRPEASFQARTRPVQWPEPRSAVGQGFRQGSGEDHGLDPGQG